MIEFRVKHPNDFAALIVDDGLRLLVPEDRHGEASNVVRVGFVVQLAELGESIERIFWSGAMVSGEQPTFLGEGEVAKDELDDIFQSLQGADQVGPVGPGAA